MQRLSEKYMSYSIEFIEKSDSLLEVSKETKNHRYRAYTEQKMKNYLKLKQLAGQ